MTASFVAYVDLSAFTAKPVAPLPEQPTALFVGMLEAYKNIDGLVAAWRLVVRELPDARLVIVGKGARRALVDELVADLPDNVEYVEQLAPELVAERMDAATMLLLPSRSEGLPRVVIESFARGRGLVASRAGGIPDAARHEEEALLVEQRMSKGWRRRSSASSPTARSRRSSRGTPTSGSASGGRRRRSMRPMSARSSTRRCGTPGPCPASGRAS